MKAVFIGCVTFSHTALAHLLSLDISIVGVVTRRESSINSDFCSLQPLAESHGIACLIAEGSEQDSIAEWIGELAPDVVFCVGWSYLLKRKILRCAPMGVIGYHPTLLPRHRGRHPIIWTLVLGLKETGSTFFFMDENADSGKIISQQRIEVTDRDNAASLYRKLEETALRQLTDLTTQMAGGTLRPVSQDDSVATTWRKRTRDDGKIDWRMSAQSIFNLVRALSDPYPGAHCVHHGKDVKISAAEVTASSDTGTEPGRVLAVDRNTLTVKCGEGALRILEHDFTTTPEEGSYL